MYYSVPYEYIKHKVDIRFTQSMVEVFYQNLRIASHKRLYGRSGQYSTVIEHMPEKHRQYTQWNAERFIRWASDIGPCTRQAVKAIIASRKVEEQSYKTCLALLKLSDTYSVQSLEQACKKALSFVTTPSFRSVRAILQTLKEETVSTESENNHASALAASAFTRGAVYYGGEHNGE